MMPREPLARTTLSHAQDRAKTLLVQLHALHFPGEHDITFFVPPTPQTGDFPVRSGTLRTAEADMLDPACTNRDRARTLLRSFRPIAWTLAMQSSEDRPTQIIEFVEEAAQTEPVDPTHGGATEAAPAELLPTPYVLDGMYMDAMNRRNFIPVCERLVGYLGRIRPSGQ